MIAVIGSTPLAASLADILGRARPVSRVPSPDAPTAEGRLAALTTLERADAVLAATGEDERSLVAASLARRMGAARAAAVVESPALAARADLASALSLDRVLQPESELAGAILAELGGPTAHAVRSLGAGRIQVTELRIGPSRERQGRTLGDLAMPAGSRVAIIRRGGKAIAPSARAVLAPDDVVLMVANVAVAAEAAARLGGHRGSASGVLIVAGPASLVRAERLAGALLREADLKAEVATAEESPRTPVGARAIVLLGTPAPLAAQLRASSGARLLGIDLGDVGGSGVAPLETAEVLAASALAMLPRQPVERLGAIEPGQMDVYRVEAADGGPWLGLPLKEVPGLRGWTILAIQAGRNAHLPHPNDAIGANEIVIIAGPPGGEAALRKGLRGG